MRSVECYFHNNVSFLYKEILEEKTKKKQRGSFKEENLDQT